MVLAPHRGRDNPTIAGSSIEDFIADLRDLSCRLLCSLRLKARLQNWHLYFFSGAPPTFRADEGDAEDACITAVAAGIVIRIQCIQRV